MPVALASLNPRRRIAEPAPPRRIAAARRPAGPRPHRGRRL